MTGKPWREEAIDRILTAFKSKVCVRAVAVFGSYGIDPQLCDEWSDLDIFVAVEDGTIPNFRVDSEWVEEIGELYVFEESFDSLSSTLRCCFRDGWKIDFVFATVGIIRDSEKATRLPNLEGARVLFSHLDERDLALIHNRKSEPFTPLRDEDFKGMIRQFRFKGLLAVDKIGRNDLLITYHLILGMMQDCCVLAMVFRDRSLNRSRHRVGGFANHLIEDLGTFEIECSKTGLLTCLERILQIFDGCATHWESSYLLDNDPILRAIEKARISETIVPK